MKTDKPSARSDTTQLRTQYLTIYNVIFAALWAAIGIKALILVSSGSPKLQTFREVEPLARWTQTLTLIEIVHAAAGTYSLTLCDHHIRSC